MSVCSSVDPCRCPLCGQANRCAMEDLAPAQPQAPCWCTREQFSAALLQQVPETARGKACICQACVQKAAQTP
ncbi:cysteine-rich CWC family protein [Limnohabitans sp.]